MKALPKTELWPRSCDASRVHWAWAMIPEELLITDVPLMYLEELVITYVLVNSKNMPMNMK